MSRDKQIDEMVSTMLEASTTANVEPVLEMEGKEVVLGENATKILNNILEQAYIPFLAEVLYNAGYRKSSEVAREIIADLVKFADDKERQMSVHGHSVWYIDADDVTDFIAELKKKYTEGE